MLEQRKFEDEIGIMMRDELEKLFLYNGKNKLFDPQSFYNTELNQIKERIRDDFLRINEFSSQSLREEYEYKYTKTVEEIEIARRNAEEARQAAENEEMMTINSLKQEHLENEEELKNLRLNGFRLSQTLEELRNRLTDHSRNLQVEVERRDAEIAELIDQINNLKIEMSTMLSFSKTLDAEVSVYARLLNERFTQYMTSETIIKEETDTKFSYDKYKESIFGNNGQDDLDREELRKKQLELEEKQRRLRELEMERERENERRRRQEARDSEERREREERDRRDRVERERREREEMERREKQREDEERRERERRQREDEERRERERRQREENEKKERERKQRDLEEQERLRELERRQYELELETKRIWEEEHRRVLEVRILCKKLLLFLVLVLYTVVDSACVLIKIDMV